MPGGEVLRVNFAAMRQGSDDIQNAINSLTTHLSDVDSAARPLFDTWGGDAKAAYDERQRIWTRASDDLKQILVSIKKALDESAQDYLDTENRNKAMFQPQ